MKAEQFTYYLKHNDMLSKADYQELEGLVAEYPYCQNLRWLLYKKSLQDGHKDYQKNLHLAAAYSRDRSYFYKQIQLSNRISGQSNSYTITDDGLKMKPISDISKQEPANDRSDIDTWSNPSGETKIPPSSTSNPNEPNIKNYISSSHLVLEQEAETDVMLEFNLEDDLDPEENAEEQSSEFSLPAKNENILFLEDLIEKDVEEKSMSSIDKAFTEKLNAKSDIDSEIGEENTLSTENFIDQVIYKKEITLEKGSHLDNLEDLNLEESKKVITDNAINIEEDITHEFDEVLSFNQKRMDPKEGLDISVDPDVPIADPEFYKEPEKIKFEIENEEVVQKNDEFTPEVDLEKSNPLEKSDVDHLVEETFEDNSEIVLEELIEITPNLSPEEDLIAEEELKIDTVISEPDVVESTPRIVLAPESKKQSIHTRKRAPISPAPKSAFSSWVKHFQTSEMSEEEQEKKTTQKAKSKKKKNSSKKKNKKRTSPTIESLENSHKKKKSKKGSAKKKKNKIFDLANQSIKDDEEIASETLAELLANQGAYAKSIRMYRKLQLIFPSKSSFFAKQIQKLIKKID